MGYGAGLQKNVNDAYSYLMEAYEGVPANRTCLFGFSRGAFTVRPLAGTLHRAGLLERNADNHIEFAAKTYSQPKLARVAAALERHWRTFRPDQPGRAGQAGPPFFSFGAPNLGSAELLTFLKAERALDLFQTQLGSVGTSCP